MKHKASTMREMGWRSAVAVRDWADLVRGRRYLVSNGRFAQAAIWDTGVGDGCEADCWFDADSGEYLGSQHQWPWWKEEECP